MKYLSKIIALLILFAFFAQDSWAQIYSFSKDPKTFQKEIKTFFKGYKIERAENIVEKFTTLIETDAFSPEEYLKLQDMCNYMLKRHHMKPVPHFADYFEILIAYKEYDIPPAIFNQWDKAYRSVLTDSKRKLSYFNDAILTLFTKNALYSSDSKTWYLHSMNYSIGYEKKKPFINVMSPITLMCRTREDTIQIHRTTGKYYPLSYKWYGEKGHVNWKRVYEDSNNVYCEINDYQIGLRNAEFTADSVTFWNKRYFSEVLIGRLTEKAMTTYAGKKSLYPKFRSYKAVYILDKLSKNLLYVGGFTQEGLRVMGSGSMEEFGPKQYAKVYISFKGKKTMKVESDRFQIEPEKIVASNARVTIYYESDSFFHPQIIFNYSINDRKVVLTRGDDGMYRSPMYDTYHQLEMEFDQLEWKIDDALMDFRMYYGSEGSAYFTSMNYFRQSEYIKTQSVLTYHPLNRLKAYCEQIDTNVFDVFGFSNFMQVRPEYLKPLLYRLTMTGFIIYKEKEGEIIVRDKTFLFENAANNKVDFDYMKLESVIKKNNAQFSLNTGNLQLEGIGNIMLSDTHRVYVYPKDQKLLLKKDRNFEFGGYVRAGLFEFFGDGFFFDYQNFKIDLSNIDSVRMYVRLDPEKPTLVAQIQSVLQDVSGNLLIDKPENKSGRINYAEYPIFNCTKNSYVYYDSRHILGGNYSRDRFYFNINPFQVDSLDKFYMDGLEFEGTFVSGGIFPIFDYKLVPQPDLSLGFTKTDEFPMYIDQGEEKGTGDLTINLSNRGLRGNGRIDYLTSITVSSDFIMYLDSMRSNSDSFNIEQNARGIYPKVKGLDVFTRWHPYTDSMIIEQKVNPFIIFEKELAFNGDLVLTPTELSSSGIMNYKYASIKSKIFTFTPTHLNSKSAILKLESDIKGMSAFVAADITMDLDVNTEITTGTSNSGWNKINFPVNKYLTSMRDFKWYSIENRVEISKSDIQPKERSYFMSTKSGQDSLLFQSTFAVYNLKNYTINAEKIPYIASADAYIYPDQGKAVIEEDAMMQSLENAVVKMDTTHFYHTIYNGLINVFGKYKFTGYGYYDYIDKFKTKQTIRLHQIRVDEENHAFAKGRIQDTIVFHLHPRFRFSGYITMNSNIKKLDFDGYIKPDHKIKDLNTFWFEYHDRINADSVYLSLNDPRGKDGRALYTGAYVGTDSPYVYNVFLGKLKHQAHPEVFGINNGVLYYDDKAKKFVYGIESKVFEDAMKGKYYTFSESTGDIYYEGPIDFGSDIKSIEVKTAGNVRYSGTDSNFIFHIAMTLNFPFDEKALGKLTDIVVENSYFRKDTRENNSEVMKAIAELIDDEKERASVLADIEGFNTFKPSKSLTKTLVFTDITMTYNTISRMFETRENKIGLSNIMKNEVHKELEGGIQTTKRRSGTVLNFMFQTDEYNYYFFKYAYGIFNVLSSDSEFNEMVTSTASKNSKPKYRIKQGSTRDLMRFKKEMKLY